MRAAAWERTGPAREVLALIELPVPEPGPGEVLVRVHASGVNPSDVKKRAGLTPSAEPRGTWIIPHSDGAGVIEKVGEKVDRRTGERVWIYNAQWMRTSGTAAEYVALPSEYAPSLPDGCSFLHGATFGIPLQTAVAALDPLETLAGRTVLIQGATGAVGHVAVQIARRAGATVIATTRGTEKAALARQAGAHHVVDRGREQVADAVRDLTGGRGVDRIVEAEFGRNAQADAAVLARHGAIVVYGSQTAPAAAIEVMPLVRKGASIRFLLVYDLTKDERSRALAAIAKLAGQLAIRIGAVFRLEEIAAAHEAREGGVIEGNVVLELVRG